MIPTRSTTKNKEKKIKKKCNKQLKYKIVKKNIELFTYFVFNCSINYIQKLFVLFLILFQFNKQTITFHVSRWDLWLQTRVWCYVAYPCVFTFFSLYTFSKYYRHTSSSLFVLFIGVNISEPSSWWSWY